MDPDVVPEAGAVAERLGAHRAGELALRVRQALLSKINSSHPLSAGVGKVGPRLRGYCRQGQA